MIGLAHVKSLSTNHLLYIGVGNASFTVAGAMRNFLKGSLYTRVFLLSYIVIPIYSFYFFSVSERILA